MAIWKLTIEDDEGQKTVVPLVRDEYTVGRREGHTIRLTERNVSRDHARLRKQGEGYVLEDLGAYNGVFVNGIRVSEPQVLAHGDLILIGDYRIEANNDDAVAKVPSSPPKAPTSVPPLTRAASAPEVKPHRLVLLTGAEGGKEFPLDKGTMVVGRGEEVDIRVNHSSVSRQHCEVHSEDQEHFEVVDRGSANGIRVNGQDVKKALLAPGDTLELGDVQLKYVAAGQNFVYDAAAAEAARLDAQGRRKTGGATWALLALLVVGAAVGGLVLAKSGGTSASTNPNVSAAPSDDVLAKAQKLKEKGDLDGAHDAVKSIAKDSALRSDPRFVAIENAWADKQLAAAKSETDLEAKKTLLHAVEASGADDVRRKTAKDLLATLPAENAAPPESPAPTATETAPVPTETAPVPTETAPTNVAVTATAKTSATLAPTATIKPTATAPAPTVTATATATATAKPSASAPPAVVGCAAMKGDYKAAFAAKDWNCVRSILLPRLNAGQISQGEAKYLKAACASLNDNECQKRVAPKL